MRELDIRPEPIGDHGEESGGDLGESTQVPFSRDVRDDLGEDLDGERGQSRRVLSWRVKGWNREVERGA